jgi:branched-chain amino acid transport system ATP-binding protein
MSGGEQQMCAIGRGLMAEPVLLMLDEPTLGLAPVIVTQVLEGLSGIRDSGITVLLVEQNVVHSLKLSNRGYVLENGRVVGAGDAAELLESPKLRAAYFGG